MSTAGAPRIWTIGHSTHPIGAFIELLAEHGIQCLADVRHYPGSRRNPQFRSDALAAAVRAAGIDYCHLVDLGGRRRLAADSANTGWRHPAFRGYADYMATPAYAAAFAALEARARAARTAVMCAELLWWRCHRSMLADELVLRGWEVVHILGPGQVAGHAFRVPARLVDGHVVYARAAD